MHSGNLLLVNAQHPLRQIDETGLIPADGQYPDILLKRPAANLLQLIFHKIASGDAIVPVSGYRSAAQQADIYNDSLKENGSTFTKKYVALPRCSEHHTGLAIDLGLRKETIDFIRPDFPYEGICAAFRKAAVCYGFVERYAQDKEHLTGIAHEPWHFRFVGFPHSIIMAENNLCLEEYIAFIKGYRAENKLVYRQNRRIKAEIYYLPFTGKTTEVSLPEGTLPQLSGNNADGFILTVWRKTDGQK